MYFALKSAFNPFVCESLMSWHYNLLMKHLALHFMQSYAINIRIHWNNNDKCHYNYKQPKLHENTVNYNFTRGSTRKQYHKYYTI